MNTKTGSAFPPDSGAGEPVAWREQLATGSTYSEAGA